MLEPNRLNPPQAFRASPSAAHGAPAVRGSRMFVSAEDFDSTGVLAGCDPCASNYWWMPELHASAPAELTVASVADSNLTHHATRRATARPQAAA